MNIRSTICTLALIAGAAVSGCTSTESRFGVHAGADTPSETRTASYEMPYMTVYYNPEPFLTQKHVAEYSRTRDANGNPAMSITLTDEGTEIMREWSGENIGNQAVMTLDGEVLSAPTLQSRLSRRLQVTTGPEGSDDWIARLETALRSAVTD